MAKKVQRLNLKRKSNQPGSEKMWFYSGFCLTDNDRIALFYVTLEIIKEWNVDIEKTKAFPLEDVHLDFTINRDLPVSYSVEAIKGDVSVSGMGMIPGEIFNKIKKYFPNCCLHKVEIWFDQKVNSLVCILAEPHGKPVGVVKLV